MTLKRWRSAGAALVAILGLGRLGISGDWAAEAPAAAPKESVLFEELPVVEAASLHAQTLEEAPASVSVITDQDIRTYGYRTLGEVLASARGFYVNYDHAYHYVGVRGFGLPGDYNVRFLVMINGHKMTENVYGSSNFFGQDFGLNLDLVKRIEIIRGPSSTLYGTNGIFATINIVTKSPVDHPAAGVSSEFGSFGERKATVSSSLDLGGGANLLLAGSVFNNGGQSLYYPEFDSPEINFGRAAGVDAERGYHTFASLVWRDWTFTGFFNNREKHTPVSWGETAVFADPDNKIWDARNFVEAAWSRNVRGGKLRWRLYYDQYRYRGRYKLWSESEDSESLAIEDNRDIGYGDWLGTQLTYRFEVPRIGALTVGGEITGDARTWQRNYSVGSDELEYLNLDTPDRGAGIFAQQEWQISRRWKTYLGLRLDDSTNHRRFLSPRVSLIYEQSPATVWKFLYGRSFRNASAYELYYQDNGLSSLANPGLRSERADTFEVALERKLRSGLGAVLSAYHYRMGDLIRGVWVDGLAQYQNVDRSRVAGLEAEIHGRPAPWLETLASVALQGAVDSVTREKLVNSPGKLARFQVASPLAKGKLRLSGAIQYVSSRGMGEGPPLPSMALLDATATARLHPEFDLQWGIRNLAGTRYYEPVALTPVLDRMLGSGRTAFVKLIWHSAEFRN